ncbi:class I SAM-dependent methyltransferase [uncultured Jatrophihabitans sp.]|uniref:class I SAM-dependent methyltransferase n=1 Tax=uncultured Jatrophihabitans sp. TaxID=1610747 RepID=UPI0035C9AA09
MSAPSDSDTTTAFWSEPANAQAWIKADSQVELLAMPRRIAAEIVAQDRPSTLRVADIGSGTGSFLAAFLDRLPDTRGVWTDVSDTMRHAAGESLARFGDRVDYRLMDVRDVAGLPDELDVVMTSRCLHHLDRRELAEFYAAVAARLAPGGWLVNLDHTRRDPDWDGRLRSARGALLPRKGPDTHHHDRPLPTLAEHLEALQSAGFADVGVAWQAFVTDLIMARKWSDS